MRRSAPPAPHTPHLLHADKHTLWERPCSHPLRGSSLCLGSELGFYGLSHVLLKYIKTQGT